MPFNAPSRDRSVCVTAAALAIAATLSACSAIKPADARMAHLCRPGEADAWIGRAASTVIAEQARQASGSRQVRLVMPNETVDDRVRADRIELFLDDRALITRTQCS